LVCGAADARSSESHYGSTSLQLEPHLEQIDKLPTNHISNLNPSLESKIQSLKGGGQPLSENDRTFFEPRFSYDFSQVRLHSDVQAAESARALNAKAYTQGQDVVFGAGQYALGTSEGRRLMAHELTHVLQQSGKK